MPYVMKTRGSPVVIVRTYQCDDCEQTFQFSHHNRDEEAPPCPFCKAASASNIPGPFAITTIKAKAVDIAQRVAEETYGMTDMNDGSREGDIAFKAPRPVQSAEAEAMTRELKDALGEQMAPEHLMPQVNEFWKTNQTPPLPPEVAAKKQAVEGAARMQAGVTRADGSDPMELLHKAKPRTKLQVIGRATGKESS